MKIYIIVFIALLTGVNTLSLAQSNIITEEVSENIRFRVDNHINTGIVVGMITSEGATYYRYGVKSLKTNDPVDENSVFEIGQVTKTFAGILLSDKHLKEIIAQITFNLNSDGEVESMTLLQGGQEISGLKLDH
jgi:hypothetical protein